MGDFDADASFSNSLAVRLTFPVGTNLLRTRPISNLGSSISLGTEDKKKICKYSIEYLVQCEYFS